MSMFTHATITAFLILAACALTGIGAAITPLTVDGLDTDCDGSDLANARFVYSNSSEGVKLWHQSGELIFVGGPGAGQYEFHTRSTVYVEGDCVSALQPLNCRRDRTAFNIIFGIGCGLLLVCFCVFAALIERQQQMQRMRSFQEASDEPQPAPPVRRADGFEKMEESDEEAQLSPASDLKDIELKVITASV
jgi:hypothetical protein